MFFGDLPQKVIQEQKDFARNLEESKQLKKNPTESKKKKKVNYVPL